MTIDVARPAPAPTRARARLSRADHAALRTYGLVQVSVWLTVYCTTWLFPPDPTTRRPGSLLDAWAQWDFVHFRTIAQHGYFGPDALDGNGVDNLPAFFPGYPLVLRAVHLLVPDWTTAGLLISLVAGAVAVVALSRIAEPMGSQPGAGRRAVLVLLVSPCAVFLVAGYTESLFLALALPAWLAVRSRRWRPACVLAAAATAVRPTGLFLAAAVAVAMLSAIDDPRRGRSSGWLALPLLPALLYATYLHARTGDWMAWQHAQARGWYRDLHSPFEAWSTTWAAAFGHEQASGYAVMFQAELVAMVVGLVLVAWLLRERRWSEAVYVGLSLAALGTSTWYVSIPRASLLWWPLWAGLAVWSTRRRIVTEAYLCLAAPLMVVLTVTFASGRWAG